MNRNTMIQVGEKYKYTPTGKVFEIAKVTDRRVSWYIGCTLPSSWGKNKMHMSWTSLKVFQEGINKGLYVKTDNN